MSNMHGQALPGTHNGQQQQQQQEGDRLSSKLGNHTSLTQEDISTWDEPTIVNPVKSEAPLDMHILKFRTRDMRKLPISKREEESFQCPFCNKVCVKQAELDNHLKIYHDVEQEDPAEISDIQQPSAKVLVEVRDEGIFTEYGDATIKPQAHEETIKPVRLPVTAASLKEHNSPTSENLAQSMDDLSISQAHESCLSEVSFADTTYSVDDVDSQTLSEVANPESPRIREPVRILLCLFMKLFFDFSQRFNNGIRQHAPASMGNAHHGSATQSAESLVSGSVPSSQVSGVKRLRDNEENEDEGDRKNNKSRKRLGQSSPEDRALACPFNKFDSRTFGVDGDPAYHVCSTFSDIKTAYFKYVLLDTKLRYLLI